MILYMRFIYINQVNVFEIYKEKPPARHVIQQICLTKVDSQEVESQATNKLTKCC